MTREEELIALLWMAVQALEWVEGTGMIGVSVVPQFVAEWAEDERRKAADYRATVASP